MAPLTTLLPNWSCISLVSVNSRQPEGVLKESNEFNIMRGTSQTVLGCLQCILEMAISMSPNPASEKGALNKGDELETDSDESIDLDDNPYLYRTDDPDKDSDSDSDDDDYYKRIFLCCIVAHLIWQSHILHCMCLACVHCASRFGMLLLRFTFECRNYYISLGRPAL